MAEEEVVRLSCQRSLKALGVANQKQINNHFIRNMYPNLGERLTELVAEKVVLPAQIVGEQEPWAGEWYVHRETLPLLESIRAGRWEPRTVFLSPFDNLICDRERPSSFSISTTELKSTFPKPSGSTATMCYHCCTATASSVEWIPDLIGKEGIYRIHALHSEQDAPIDAHSGSAVAESLLELAQYIGAARIELGARIPALWRKALEELTHRL